MPELDQAQSYIAWKAWNPEKFGRYSNSDRVHFAAELKVAGVYITQNTKVLEVGFGNASFAGWVRSISPHYVGTEANHELVARAGRLGIEAHLGTFDLETIANGRQFDLIAIFDVLEHLAISDILTVLTSAGHCLSDAGRIVFRVPSGDSPFSGSLMYGDITHRTRLGSKAIFQLAELTGLEVISVHDAAFPVFGLGVLPAIRRIAISPLRKVIGGLINAVFNGNERAIMSLNLVASLRRAPSNETKAARKP
ncbi:MAG: class I SAM-dependent methyltransferase [Rhodanobacteraceae bacterium]